MVEAGVLYINFAHSGPIPGPITFTVYDLNFNEGDILKCYYYNEETKLYERVQDAEMINDWEVQLNIDHCSKYLVTKTELQDEFVIADNDEDKGTAENGTGTGETIDEETDKDTSTEGENKEDNKVDNKEENKVEDKEENKVDNKEENKTENKEENKVDNKEENKVDNKEENKE